MPSKIKTYVRLTNLLILLGVVLLPFASAADTPRAREYQVKAVFLYNLTHFVQWPPDSQPNPNTPLVIAILGQDPFGVAIDRAVAGERVNGRPIVIRRYRNLPAIGPSPVHILFVSASHQKMWPQIIEKMRTKKALLVGDLPGFAQSGGMVNLLRRANKVRVEINMQAVRAAGLKINSKLARVATLVQGKK